MALYLNNKLTFIDSFQFMSQSLDKLSNNLPGNHFIYTKEVFSQVEQYTLMKKKGVYPYDYLDNTQKFDDATLPKKADLIAY